MTEFEKAVFRVYENSIDGLNFDGIYTNLTTKFILFTELLFRCLAFVSFLILLFMHWKFVGDHKLNCLPSLIAVQGYNTTTADGRLFFNFTDDYILNMNVYLPVDEIGNMKLVEMNSSSEPVPMLLRKEPDFEYARSGAVLSLKSEVKKKFDIVNITIPHKECFGEYPYIGGSLYGLLAYFDGVGTVLTNNLMYTSKCSGVLMKYTGERAVWSSAEVYSEDHDWLEGGVVAQFSRANYFMWRKFKILFNSCLAFFLLSTTTAMLIRILLSSGVIILYPLLLILEYLYSRGISMHTAYRLMTLAYPWLGVPMEILRHRRISAVPFLLAHATQIFVYYVMYEGVQIVMSMWLYNHNIPDLADVWVYSLMMLAEYFSIVYVRSVASIRFFPRFFCGFFVLYHIYLYSFPAGFHQAALVCFSTATVSLLLFSLRKMEYPSYMRGDVVIDRPRGLYNSLPYAYNGIFLPPEFTIFMPVNRRARNAYDITEPPEGTDGADEDELLPPRDLDQELDEVDVGADLEQGGSISATETPLLFHHYSQAQRPPPSPRNSGSAGSGPGLPSYLSISPHSVAPSGRRRRRLRPSHSSGSERGERATSSAMASSQGANEGIESHDENIDSARGAGSGEGVSAARVLQRLISATGVMSSPENYQALPGAEMTALRPTGGQSQVSQDIENSRDGDSSGHHMDEESM